QPFATLDAFQQEARTEGGELHERRHRCVQIARYIEWRFQRVLLITACQKTGSLQTTKNPSRGLSGDGFLLDPRIIQSRETSRLPTPYVKCATTRGRGC